MHATAVILVVGWFGLLFGTRWCWLLLDKNASASDSLADVSFRVRAASRPPGSPLRIPVSPGYIMIPLMTAAAALILLVALGGSWTERWRQFPTLAIPMEIGALLAIRELRTQFVLRWRVRRAAPDDRVTREFGEIND